MKQGFMLLLITMSLTAYSQPGKGFQFVESSSGLNYPTWESGMTELEFADINMDGFVDILSIGDHGCPNIGAQEHGIMVWFGDGKGNWAVQMTGDFGYGGIAIGDVNNDGLWDVGMGMHHAYSSTDLGDQLLEVALGDGSGTNWTPWDNGLATSGESWAMFGTDFADVDNDGDLDIGSVSMGAGDGVHVYLNQGDGSWIHSFGFLSGNSNDRFVFGDINNDGNVDFVVTHEAGIAYFGDGTGSFVNADYNLPNYGFPMGGPSLGDLNHDGGKDLAYANPSGGINIWVFDPLTSHWIDYSGALPASGSYQEVQLCDFNGDDMLDLAAFGDAHLTVWKGILEQDSSVTWTQEFTMITSNNGNCDAFRAGGDVDRNGYPDLTLVEKVGNWPNDKNHLKCFKETTPFSKSSIRATFPRGNERFKQGSTQFIDWISAVPDTSSALVQIDYSLQGTEGPWTNLTTGIANSGRFQWILPQTISSNNCFIRYLVPEDEDTLTALTQEPFTILGDNAVMADFMASPTVAYPDDGIQFTDQSLGLITSWNWDFDNDGTVDATSRNPSWAYLLPGLYSVKLTVSDGTTTMTEIKTGYITILPHVAIDEATTSISFSLSPNPTSGILTIRYQVPPENLGQPLGIPGKSKMILDLFDGSGKQVVPSLIVELTTGTLEQRLDLSQLPTGTYTYRIQVGDLKKTGKIIRIR